MYYEIPKMNLCAADEFDAQNFLLRLAILPITTFAIAYIFTYVCTGKPCSKIISLYLYEIHMLYFPFYVEFSIFFIDKLNIL